MQFSYLIFDVSNPTLLSPIEIGGKIISRQDRGLISVNRELNAALQAKEVPAEFLRSEVGEFGDAVDSGGVELLVALGAAQVSLEDREPVIVLLLSGVGLAVVALEEREVVLRIEEMIFTVRYNLADQEILGLVVVNDGRYLSEAEVRYEEQEEREKGEAFHLERERGVGSED